MSARCTGFGVLFYALLLAALGAGCENGKSVGKVSSLQDQKKLANAVHSLRSGGLIQKMSASVFMVPPEEPVSADAPLEPASGSQPIAEVDGCPGVAQPQADASEEEMKLALRDFGNCMRSLLKPYSHVSEAVTYFKIYNGEDLHRPLSELTESELEAFLISKKSDLEEVSQWLATDASSSAKFRTQFSDADLQEFMKLVGRRRDVLIQIERKILGAVGFRIPLVEHFAKTLDRYEALMVLYRNRADVKGFETVQGLMEIFRRSKADVQLGESILQLNKSPAFYSLIHPYAIDAIVPSEGSEEEPLNLLLENPYGRAVRALAELGGPEAFVENSVKNYQILRDFGKYPIPEHPAPAPGAVRVAFIDSGIDYYEYPELALFLGTGKDGQLESADFLDGGTLPWVLDRGDAMHGSQTVGSWLTVIAQEKPELLEERKVDLAVWKNWTARNLLSGNIKGSSIWNTPLSAQSGIIRKIRSPGVAPQIVSVSMGFSMQEALVSAQSPDLIKESPWLWVMAAGNEGRELKLVNQTGDGFGPTPGCFSDIPRNHRDASKILCVGALKQGMIEPMIANYSNFGEPVDVYAFESYFKACPAGTSCSTPAVSAAVTLIAAKYPQLTPAQLKEVIVEAAVEKVLKVDLNLKDSAVIRKIEQGVLKKEMKVRFFNPHGMMDRAYEIAQRKLKSS